MDDGEREIVMLARVSTEQMKPDQVEEAKRLLRETWAPFLRQQRGSKGLITLQARDDPGKFMHLTVWETEADFEAYKKERLRPGAPPRLPVAAPDRPAGTEMFEVTALMLTPGSGGQKFARVFTAPMKPDIVEEVRRRAMETWFPFWSQQRGFTGVLSLESRDVPGKIIWLTLWTTAADIDAHTTSDEYRQLVTDFESVFQSARTAPPASEVFEVTLIDLIGVAAPA